VGVTVATVLELTASYENFLIPVLTPREGVCKSARPSILPALPLATSATGTIETSPRPRM